MIPSSSHLCVCEIVSVCPRLALPRFCCAFGFDVVLMESERKRARTKCEREDEDAIPKVRFLKSPCDFNPPWDNPVVLPETIEAIEWCAARSSNEAKHERESTMERIRKLSCRMRESGPCSPFCVLPLVYFVAYRSRD